MFGVGATELLIILVIVVVLFGARRLPEIGSGIGKAIKNFRAGMSGQDEFDVRSDAPGRESVTEGSPKESLEPGMQKTKS
jgi:sec-independent protein translocase protein TatA